MRKGLVGLIGAFNPFGRCFAAVAAACRLDVGLPLRLDGRLEIRARLAPDVIRKRGQVPRRVRQLQHPRDDIFKQLRCVPLGWVDGELFEVVVREVNSANFLPCSEVKYKAVQA